MLDIVFRGQRKDTGQWIEGDLHRYGPEAFIFSCLDFPDGPDWYEVDPATVSVMTRNLWGRMGMAEYIEREALIARLRVTPILRCGVPVQVMDGVIDLVKAEPAADVAPVVPVLWKYYRKQGKAVCRNCSFERDLDSNFGRAVSCPNCGARMEGGE